MVCMRLFTGLDQADKVMTFGKREKWRGKKNERKQNCGKESCVKAATIDSNKTRHGEDSYRVFGFHGKQRDDRHHPLVVSLSRTRWCLSFQEGLFFSTLAPTLVKHSTTALPVLQSSKTMGTAKRPSPCHERSWNNTVLDGTTPFGLKNQSYGPKEPTRISAMDRRLVTQEKRKQKLARTRKFRNGACGGRMVRLMLSVAEWCGESAAVAGSGASPCSVLTSALLFVVVKASIAFLNQRRLSTS